MTPKKLMRNLCKIYAGRLNTVLVFSLPYVIIW